MHVVTPVAPSFFKDSFRYQGEVFFSIKKTFLGTLQGWFQFINKEFSQQENIFHLFSDLLQHIKRSKSITKALDFFLFFSLGFFLKKQKAVRNSVRVRWKA